MRVPWLKEALLVVMKFIPKENTCSLTLDVFANFVYFEYFFILS